MRVIWRTAALADLDHIGDTIAEDNLAAARRVVRTIRTKARSLSRYPGLGRTGKVAGTRELVLDRYPYIIAYRVETDAVRILAVVHTSQRWPAEF